MAGADVEFAYRADMTIGELKRMIAHDNTLGVPPVWRQRLVLMPAHGGHEPHEILADSNLISACNFTTSAPVVELVVLEEVRSSKAHVSLSSGAFSSLLSAYATFSCSHPGALV
jgi:hypothetical protein